MFTFSASCGGVGSNSQWQRPDQARVEGCTYISCGYRRHLVCQRKTRAPAAEQRQTWAVVRVECRDLETFVSAWTTSSASLRPVFGV